METDKKLLVVIKKTSDTDAAAGVVAATPPPPSPENHLNNFYRRETNDPTLILPVWEAIRSSSNENSKKATSASLFKCLQKDLKMNMDTIVQILTNMVNDGFVSGVKSKNSEVFFIPDFINDLDNALIKRDIHESEQRDWYCYECHLGGTGLVDCIQCPRVFHLECVRQHVDFPLQSFKEPVPVFIRNTYRQVYGHAYVDREEALEEVLKTDTLENNEQEFDVTKYCVRCRMMNQPKFTLSNDTTDEELNYLLNLALNTIRTWIAHDTFSSQYNRNISAQDLKVLVNILLQNPITIEKMLKKIAENQYKSLTEFQCDLLDIQHCIGVIRGVNCQEYEAARYLYLNGVNETNEIVNCKQCYRYSNEKIYDNWFALPCKPNHQLVYAKQTGYPMWPAKVVRMINDELYDVRFFGQHHSRAEIPVRNVHLVDGNVPMKSSKAKQTQSLKKAISEFQLHQKLLKKSSTVFEFSSNNNNKMIENLLKGIDDDDNDENVDEIGVGGSSDGKKRGKITNKRVGKKTVGRKRQSLQSIDYKIEEESAESTISDYLGPVEKKRAKSSTEIMVIESMNGIKNDIPVAGGGGGGGDEKMTDKFVDTLKVKNHESVDTEKIDITEENIIKNKKYDGRPVLHKLGSKTENKSFISINDERCISPEPPSLTSSITPEIDNQMDFDHPEKFSRELDLLTDLNEVKCLALSVVTAHIQQKRELLANISKIKKKHWCIICEKEATYYCCWCCTYCSTNCQNYHWKNGHKTVCRNPSFTNLNNSGNIVGKSGRKSGLEIKGK